ncbi:TetR family transcriptional regulator [Frondihabitans sucicola]|uniref:TetR family transcriptional regulator n=1 Tax=Frondihabitans sucicola TaxID=1268041 RepID=A0ABN6XS86_9MICO|nr:TetR/AcrR family transcriptional regulator [Frondihabitans sucicola]BDZ47864.1 TetR family transcriptional regulator [Frondihabitans sucicola]
MLLEKNETETRILNEARKLFNRKGYVGMTLRQIASAVGMEAQSIYNYTPSKQALVEKMMRNGTEILRDKVETALATAGPTQTDRLYAAVGAHTAHYCSSDDLVMVREGLVHLDPEIRTGLVTMLKSYEQIFRDILRAGIDGGEFRDVDVTRVTFAILGMGESVINWYRPGGRLTPTQIGDEYADLALHLVGARYDHPEIT